MGMTEKDIAFKEILELAERIQEKAVAHDIDTFIFVEQNGNDKGTCKTNMNLKDLVAIFSAYVVMIIEKTQGIDQDAAKKACTLAFMDIVMSEAERR